MSKLGVAGIVLALVASVWISNAGDERAEWYYGSGPYAGQQVGSVSQLPGRSAQLGDAMWAVDSALEVRVLDVAKPTLIERNGDPIGETTTIDVDVVRSIHGYDDLRPRMTLVMRTGFTQIGSNLESHAMPPGVHLWALMNRERAYSSVVMFAEVHEDGTVSFIAPQVSGNLGIVAKREGIKEAEFLLGWIAADGTAKEEFHQRYQASFHP